MSIEENKEVVRRFSEAIRKSDIPTINALMTDDCVFHMLGNDPPADLNRDQVKEMFTSPAYSTETVKVEDVIAEGDRVSVRSTTTVKHPGKSPSATRFSTYRIQDGKVAEFWTLLNSLGLFQQLGFIPSTEEILKKAPGQTSEES